MLCCPGCRCKFSDALDGCVCETGQNVGEVIAYRDFEPAAAFETAIIERYRRRESSVDEALIEMYLAGVSVRRVENITQALWGTKVSASTVSELNQKIYGKIDEWRLRPLVADC